MSRDSAKRVDILDLVNPQTGRVRDVSPHRLGDTFSVHAMKLDNSDDVLRLLQEHLVHASFNTTAKYQKVAGEVANGMIIYTGLILPLFLFPNLPHTIATAPGAGSLL